MERWPCHLLTIHLFYNGLVLFTSPLKNNTNVIYFQYQQKYMHIAHRLCTYTIFTRVFMYYMLLTQCDTRSIITNITISVPITLITTQIYKCDAFIPLYVSSNLGNTHNLLTSCATYIHTTTARLLASKTFCIR